MTSEVIVYDGRFIVHGGQPEHIEGTWDGALIVIEFPDDDRTHKGHRRAGLIPVARSLRTASGRSLVVQRAGRLG